MSKTLLNDEANQRFRYYFDRKLTLPEGCYRRTVRRTLSYVLIALFSLSWVPIDHYVKAHQLRTHEAAKEKVQSDVYGRMAQTRNIFQVIASFDTGLTQNTEYQLAATITDVAEQYAMDPYLILAVIETESSFYNTATSNVGAKGLMQILPVTGQELAQKLQIPYRKNHTLFQPFLNVQMGTHYLSYLVHKFEGDVELALLAYNRGPNRLRREMVWGKEVPTEYSDRVLTRYSRLTKKYRGTQL